MAKFDKWDHRFIEMVNLVAQWSSCFQENRKIGAVIVKNKRVLTDVYKRQGLGISFQNPLCRHYALPKKPRDRQSALPRRLPSPASPYVAS